MKFTRRDFIATTAAASASLALDLQAQNKPDNGASSPAALPKKPVIICAHNGYNYLDRGYAVLASGGDTLDAVMQVITGPEDDPNDDSVGLGGLPNEDCVVQLDSCCMHGPTRMAGSVAGVEEIKNVSLLAKAVMEHTGHVMLVGEGAQKFGFKMGFPRENLLTEHSRKIWQLWRETMSNDDWWGPGLASPKFKFPQNGGDNESELQEERMRKIGRTCGEDRHRAGAAYGGDRARAETADRNHPLLLGEREGRDVGRDDHQRASVEDLRTRRRFAHHRCRQLHRPGRGFGGRDRQW